jgi:hypothetical protein
MPEGHGPRWEGRPGGYQAEAAERMWTERTITVQPWHWISATCGDPRCLDVEHLVSRAPRWLDYPPGVCVYCGLTAEVRDHLLPEPLTGRAGRLFVLTVPACYDCNAAISDHPEACITDRRAVAHRRIARRHAAALRCRNWTPDELIAFEGRMRDHVRTAMGRKRLVLERLNWPEDPAYDLRALQRSGIEDPYSTGLLR